jgi:hypothetical protein
MMQEFKLPIKFYGQLANQPIVHNQGILLLAVQTVSLNTTVEQPIKLNGGSKFVITGSIATNLQGTCNNVDYSKIYSKPNPIATACDLLIEYNITSLVTLLVAPDDYIEGSIGNAGCTFPLPPKPLTGDTVYLNVNTPEGSPSTVDLYIYGYIIK